MAAAPVLELRDIAKEYSGNRVLKGVSLSLAPGEIHALVGENGAGKSTLMNILFGMPVIHETGGFEGQVVFDGKAAAFKSPAEAMNSGIGMVHQEFMLISGFTAAENIKLNREPVRENLLSRTVSRKLATLDRTRIRNEAVAAIERVGLSIDAMAPVAGLPVSFLQFVEIARELDKKNLKLLVFDEPTAVLTESEADRLLELMKGLAAKGIAILFITHRLHEVMEVADRITVLRDGEVVRVLPRPEASIGLIAELMVGRKIEEIRAKDMRGASTGAILTIRDYHVDMPGEEVKGLDLEVMKGEILGLGGLAGYGKVGVANGLMGQQPARGTVLLNGQPLALNDPAASLRAGLAFVSEDRRGVGIMADESIELNIGLPALRAQGRFLRPFPLSALALLDDRELRRHSLEMIERLDIRCTGPAQAVGRLSGGNQQKVCVAGAMTLEPSILLVSEPTRGIDIGAKKRVLDLIVSLNRDRGVTVIVTSSELAELRGICDRIAIITRGKVHAVLAPDDSDQKYGLAMAGEEIPA